MEDRDLPVGLCGGLGGAFRWRRSAPGLAELVRDLDVGELSRIRAHRLHHSRSPSIGVKV
jgi:hypothetical protein